MTDLLARIDEVTAPRCGWCTSTLADNAPSGDFCNELHQQLWQGRSTLPAWSVPPRSGALRLDLAAASAAAASARTPEERAAAAQYAEQISRDAEQISRDVALRFNQMIEDLKPAFQTLADAVANSLAAVGKLLHAAGFGVPEGSGDAKARALELRRNRNTGPKQHPRAPRQITPRRSR
ncbi:hypothetical protein [Saccharothrix xinjiangensis]|uniref:Uncharacterized protein n=1 Tax=Saccharothrix xinjiangensis TaxID=204798 RepID=A0ABV9XT70_9PSEU